MAIDTEEKRNAMLGVAVAGLVVPSGGNIDSRAERMAMLGIYSGFATPPSSIGVSSGARQRIRTVGLIARV